MPAGYVYILASKPNGTLYIGVTSNLIQRVSQHREGTYDGFTKEYDVKSLVYYEVFEDIREAIAREKSMKAWKREWKIKLIEKDNPKWFDLFETVAA